jgi:sirohydrochlorin ferrochelatase
MERLASLLSQSQGQIDTKLQAFVATRAGMQGSRGNKEDNLEIQNSKFELPRLVGTACLELSPVSLHKQITEFGDRAVECGYSRLQIVPLFLLPGVHVMEDIPAQVALAQQTLGQKLKLELRSHLGTHPGLIDLLANQLATTPSEAWILLAHGSRRAGAKQPVEAIAKQLGALSAYWSVAPSLQSRLQKLVSAGHQQIGIMPYFLFAGGITDAIAQAVEQLQAQFPAVNLHLAEPLGASQELADLILDLLD